MTKTWLLDLFEFIFEKKNLIILFLVLTGKFELV